MKIISQNLYTGDLYGFSVIFKDVIIESDIDLQCARVREHQLLMIRNIFANKLLYFIMELDSSLVGCEEILVNNRIKTFS
jgi:hypothetical protein